MESRDNVVKFWINDPKVLLDSYLDFIPTKNMSTNQKYNSITLFAIYVIILTLLFKSQSIIIIIMFVVIMSVIIMANVDNPNVITDSFQSDVGYIDGNNKINFTRTTNKISNDSNLSYTCRKPTPNNPFMNPNISDDVINDPIACNSDNENINNEVIKSFNTDLYMDIDDVFDKKNSQRQFYTIPSTTIPNNQIDFANWLYKTSETCKENQAQCLRYEDIRYKH